MTQALRVEGVLPTTDPEAEAGSDTASAQALFDTSKNTLVLYFQDHAKALLTDGDSTVRRTFLRSVSGLCVFFGQSKANDIILSHLNTYLNDKDWILRCAFFETITGIATYLGSVSLEEYIMPLMVQSLTDPEEFVVEKVLRSLANMAELGLFQRSKTWELVGIVGRFTMHPNIWIRQSAVGFIAASTKWLAPADIYCIVYPLVQPFLKTKMVDLSTLSLLETLTKPVCIDPYIWLGYCCDISCLASEECVWHGRDVGHTSTEWCILDHGARAAHVWHRKRNYLKGLCSSRAGWGKFPGC